jgi:hypothetical protein
MNMLVDPITEEIRNLRHTLAAQRGNDLDRIYEDLRRSERASGRRFVSLPPRPVRTTAIVQPPQTLEVAGAERRE